MKTLKISNLLSMALIFFAAAAAILLGTIAVIFFPEGVPLVILLVMGAILVSIPVSIVSLVCACRLNIVSVGYVVFSIVSSFIIAGAGWLVIPFMLNRDIKAFSRNSMQSKQAQIY